MQKKIQTLPKKQLAYSGICKRFGGAGAAAFANLKQISYSKDLEIAFSHSTKECLSVFKLLSPSFET